MIFTFYHGKSPLNHHLGEYFCTIPNHLKQIDSTPPDIFHMGFLIHCWTVLRKHFPLHFSKFVVWCPNVNMKNTKVRLHHAFQTPSCAKPRVKDWRACHHRKFEKLQNQLPMIFEVSAAPPHFKGFFFPLLSIIVIFQKWWLKTRQCVTMG